MKRHSRTNLTGSTQISSALGYSLGYKVESEVWRSLYYGLFNKLVEGDGYDVKNKFQGGGF